MLRFLGFVSCYLLLSAVVCSPAYKQIANLQTPRATASSAVASETIFIIGGATGSSCGTLLATVEGYNVTSNSWSYYSALPVPVILTVTETVAGTIYLMGGQTSTGLLSAVYSYSGGSDSWIQVSTMLTPRTNLKSGAVNGIIYTFGGINGSMVVGNVESYNPSDNVWEVWSPMPTPRAEGCSVTVGSKIYVIGGINAEQQTVTTVEAFDAISHSWSTLPPLPYATRSCIAFAIEETLYVSGGFDDLTRSPVMYTQTFQLLNGRYWSTEVNDFQILNAAVSVYRNSAFVMGGYDAINWTGCSISACERFNSDANWCISDAQVESYYSFTNLDDYKEDLVGNGYRLFNVQGITPSLSGANAALANWSVPFDPNPDISPQLSLSIWIQPGVSDFYLIEAPFENPKTARIIQYQNSAWVIGCPDNVALRVPVSNQKHLLTVTWDQIAGSVQVYINDTLAAIGACSYAVQPYKYILATNVQATIWEMIFFRGVLSTSDIVCILEKSIKGCLGSQLPVLPSAIQPTQKYPIYMSRLIPDFTSFTEVATGTPYHFLGLHVSGGIVIGDGFNQTSNNTASLRVIAVNDKNFTINYETYGARYPTGLSAFNASDLAELAIFGVNGWTSAYDASNLYNGKFLVQTFFEYIRETTLRGIPLYDVLSQIANNAGAQFAVAAVGGSVRDLLVGAPVKDVDIATAMPYRDIVFRLRDIFKVHGTPVDDTVLEATGKRKQFGMIKLLNIPDVDNIFPNACEVITSDPLDIGPFKAIPTYINEGLEAYLNKYAVDKSSKNSKYLFGYSYSSDATTRDYTVNAIYLEPFGTNPKVIDVFGYGRSDAIGNILRFATFSTADKSWRQLFSKDIGSQFRFWKFMMKSNPSWKLADEMMASLVCGETVENIGITGQVDLFWNKMYKKLFAAGMVYSEVNEKLLAWRAAIDTLSVKQNVSANVQKECQYMWNEIYNFSLSSATEEFLQTLRGENTEAFGMAQLVSCWQNQSPFSLNDANPLYTQLQTYEQRQASKAIVTVDSTLVDQFACYFSAYGPTLSGMPVISNDVEDVSSEYNDDDADDDDSGVLEGYLAPIWNDLSILSPEGNQQMSADRLFIAYTYKQNYYNSSNFDQWAASLASGNPLAWQISSIVVESAETLQQTYQELLSATTDNTVISSYVEALSTAAQNESSIERSCLNQAINFCFIAQPTSEIIQDRIGCTVYSILAARVNQSYWQDFGMLLTSDTPKPIMINNNTIQFYPVDVLNQWFLVMYGGPSSNVPQELLSVLNNSTQCSLLQPPTESLDSSSISNDTYSDTNSNTYSDDDTDSQSEQSISLGWDIGITIIIAFVVGFLGACVFEILLCSRRLCCSKGITSINSDYDSIS